MASVVVGSGVPIGAALLLASCSFTPTICVPPPPAPGDCAVFGVTDDPGRFTITITPACHLADDTITIENARTAATFEVVIDADGSSAPTSFTGAALGDQLRYHGPGLSCRFGCFRFEGPGPGVDCESVAPRDFVGTWQWQPGSAVSSTCPGETQGELVDTIDLSIDGEGDLHAAGGAPFLACEAKLELDVATVRPARVTCVTLSVEEFPGGSRKLRVTDTFGEGGLTLTPSGDPTLGGALEVLRHVEDLESGTASDCMMSFNGYLRRISPISPL